MAEWDANSPELQRNLREVGLEYYDVEVGGLPGAPAERVAAELAVFDRTLAEQLDELDRTVRREHLDEDVTSDLEITAAIIRCAWAHGEWLRIHPFPDGNGRTARILVNGIALRYGLPAFMRVRPRSRTSAAEGSVTVSPTTQ